jgi:hypothetical protein
LNFYLNFWHFNQKERVCDQKNSIWKVTRKKHMSSIFKTIHNNAEGVHVEFPLNRHWQWQWSFYDT